MHASRCAVHESGYGTKPTSRHVRSNVANGGKSGQHLRGVSLSAFDPKQTLAREIAPASARETRTTLRNAHARGPVRALACRRPRSGQSGTDAPSL